MATETTPKEVLVKQELRLLVLPPQDRFKNIVLTDEEKEWALAIAREKKYYELKNKEYWDSVKNPKYTTFQSVDEYFAFIVARGKETVPVTAANPNGFVVDKENEEILRLLCMYFMHDKGFEKAGYSLNKGIFLFGNVGTTKTTTMKLFQNNPTNSFGVIRCNKVASLYTQGKDLGGYPAIEQYMRIRANEPVNAFGNIPLGYCFDDLGTETTKKHFGNESNVMQEVILARYDSCPRNATHITSNLTTAQLEESYGARVRSRLRELVNLIEFKGSSDRRK